MNLREYFDSECLEIKSFCTKHGISEQTVHTWLRGDVMPLQIHREAICRITKGKVKLKDWKWRNKDDVHDSKTGLKDNAVHRTKRVRHDKPPLFTGYPKR